MASNSAHAAHFSHFTQENEDKQSNLGRLASSEDLSLVARSNLPGKKKHPEKRNPGAARAGGEERRCSHSSRLLHSQS